MWQQVPTGMLMVYMAAGIPEFKATTNNTASILPNVFSC